MRRALAIALTTLVLGCGGSKHGEATGPRTGSGKTRRTHDVKVDPKAQREFELAIRAWSGRNDAAAQAARTHFQKALELDASLWEAWHDLGVIAFDAGDDDAAVKAFDQALALHKDYAPTLIARAEAHRHAGDTGGAEKDLRAALATLADDDTLRRDVSARLAAILRDAERFGDAIDVLRDTLRIVGPSAAIYTELGLVYLAKDRLDVAELVLAKAYELDPTSAAVANGQATLATKRGDSQLAFLKLDAAVAIDPKDRTARFNKAALLLDAGDAARALVELRQLADSDPEDYASAVALGVAQRGTKDYPAAKQTWERVTKTARAGSAVWADASWNLVILKSDFLEDVAGAKAELDRYLQQGPRDHDKRKAADAKKKELGL